MLRYAWRRIVSKRSSPEMVSKVATVDFSPKIEPNFGVRGERYNRGSCLSFWRLPKYWYEKHSV